MDASRLHLGRSFLSMTKFAIPSDMANAYVDYAASVIESNEQTMTSLQIAEITGKRHDAVLRDVRNLLEQGVADHNFVASEYVDKTGRSLPCYILTKKGCLILASGYNVLLREKIINRWEQLEVERQKLAPTNNPQLAYVQTQVYLAETISRNLRLNEASRLGMYQSIAAPYNLAIPQYVQSKGVTKSAKDLLKEIGSTMSVIRFNTLLTEQGYLETKTRPSVNGKTKNFKSITDKGLAYGENLQSPKNQKETQPHWYADRFAELYNLVTA